LLRFTLYQEDGSSEIKRLLIGSFVSGVITEALCPVMVLFTNKMVIKVNCFANCLCAYIVCRGLLCRITKIDREKGENNKPFLNIVAGTSIGAINAAIIVSYVVENDTWDGSAERLNEFWEYVSKESSVDLMPGVTAWWDHLHNNVHSGIASGEAARRYYSAKEFAIRGVPSVFSPLMPLVDARFFDFQKVWYRFDSRPLKRSLQRFAKFPIAKFR
jgi:NTE family protein